MVKKLIVVGCTLLLTGAVGLTIWDEYSFQHPNFETDGIMEVAIYYSLNHSYHFLLNPNGILNGTVGEVGNEWRFNLLRGGVYHLRKDIWSNSYIGSIYSSSEIQLNTSEIKSLIDIANELQASSRTVLSEPFFNRPWNASLIYNGNFYSAGVLDVYQTEILARLSDEIIKLSPIPVEPPSVV